MTIDWWTFGLQTVNVLILVWLLARFFWRPVAAIIEQRRQQTQGLLDLARADRDAAALALAEMRRRESGFAKERESMLALARQDAAATRRMLLDQTEGEAAALREQARIGLAHQQAEAERIWSERADRLALTIAAKLAARLSGDAVTDAFLHWLIDKIAALPAHVREDVAAAEQVEIVSAGELDPAQRARVAAAAGAALGATPAFVFKTDAELIAGLELRTPHFVVSNSWRADLAQILAEISRDERH